MSCDYMASLVCGLWGFPDGSVGKEPRFDSWVGKIPRRRDRLHTPVFLGFPGGSADKESICNAGYLGSVPELGRSPGEGKDSPLQYSGLENSMDCIVHGVAKSRTCPSNFHTSHTLLNRYLYLIHWMSTSKEVFVT